MDHFPWLCNKLPEGKPKKPTTDLKKSISRPKDAPLSQLGGWEWWRNCGAFPHEKWRFFYRRPSSDVNVGLYNHNKTPSKYSLVGGDWNMNGLWLSVQLGISSSQLTKSYFSEGWLNHHSSLRIIHDGYCSYKRSNWTRFRTGAPSCSWGKWVIFCELKKGILMGWFVADFTRNHGTIVLFTQETWWFRAAFLVGFSDMSGNIVGDSRFVGPLGRGYSSEYDLPVIKQGKIPANHMTNFFGTGWGPQDSVQLPYKWLNSMVYGRYNELVNGGCNGL